MNVAPMVAADAMTGSILGAYAVTIAVLATYSWWVIRRGKRLAEQVEDEKIYWK